MGKTGCEVAFLPMVGAICSRVQMSLPKLVHWLPEEGFIPDLQKQYVDRLFEDRGLRHVVPRFDGSSCPCFHNVNLPPAMIGGGRLGLLGRERGGTFGSQILQLTELVYHLHKVIHRLRKMKHKLPEDGTFRLKP